MVSAGSAFSCAVRRSGRAACWGAVTRAGIGNVPSALMPTEVVGLTDVVEIVAGDQAACARLRDDSMWCWGTLDPGGLGDGVTLGTSLLPVKVKLP